MCNPASWPYQPRMQHEETGCNSGHSDSGVQSRGNRKTHPRFACRTDTQAIACDLVDNASTDLTYNVLQNWKNSIQTDDFIVDILQCPVHGAAAARNTGLSAVKEPWTMFFDSDDIMPPTHAENVVKYINETDVIGWDVEEISGNKSKILPFCIRAKKIMTIFFMVAWQPNGGRRGQNYSEVPELGMKTSDIGMISN